MKSSHLILVGALAVGVAAVVWYLPNGGFKFDSEADPRRADPSTASEPSAATPGKTEKTQPSREIVRNVPASEGTSTFFRRQELERTGYDAGQAGHANASQRLKELSAPGDRAAFIRGMFAGLREHGIQDVLQALKQIPDADERRMALLALVEAQQFEAPAAKPPPQPRTTVEVRRTADLFVNGMEELITVSDPLNARSSSDQGSLILSLADSPDLAAGLAQELLSGVEKVSVLSDIASKEVANNPARAIAYGDRLEGKERERFLSSFAASWAHADPAAAWAWASGRQEPASRDAMQEAVIKGLVVSDPRAAAENLAQMNEGPARARAFGIVGNVWGEKDTQQALDWAGSLPSQAERDAALASIRQSAPVGIGAVLSTDSDGFPVIREVIAGGAASENPQIAQGSRIMSVRDASGKTVSLQGVNLQEAVSLLRGAPGSLVTLEIIPPGGTHADRRTVAITRRQLIRKG